MFRGARILSIIYFCLLSLCGCQSEAEFPGTCGNGVREGGEACDGAAIDPARNTCDENGAGTGTVSCNSDCTLNLDLCTGAFDCDPLTNDGCDNGKVCYFDSSNTKTDCSNAGTKDIRAPCGHSTECQAQMVCVNGQCHQFCEAGDACNNGHNTCITGSWPKDWGNCLLPPVCDPVTQGGCSGLSSCYILNTSGELGCIPPGSVTLGLACSATNNCAPGLQCTSITDGTCVQLCWVTADCDSGDCMPYSSWTTGLGVCI